MEKVVKIPEGVSVRLEGRTVIVSGPRGELRRDMKGSPVKVQVAESKVVVASENDRRRIKSHAGTWAAHIRNMVTGVSKGYEAKLKIVYSHFPMKFSVEGHTVKVGNFLGERNDRKAKITGHVKIELQKDIVVVRGNDRDEVGQAAAVIEQTARVKGFDKRVFQDGIHLIQKSSPIEGE
jgi:large subunit ribosomal protein L6